MDNKASSFSDRLREILSIQKISQKELSRITGISESNISRYVRGYWECKPDAVYKIAKATNCTVEWLMGYDSTEEHNDNILKLKLYLFGCSNAPDSLLDNVREYASFLFEQHKKANGYSE